MQRDVASAPAECSNIKITVSKSRSQKINTSVCPVRAGNFESFDLKRLFFYDGVKRPHLTIQCRHVYKAIMLRLQNTRHVYNSQPSRLQNYVTSTKQLTVTSTIHNRHVYTKHASRVQYNT